VQKYEPGTYDQPAEGPALVRIHVEEEFTGDIVGSGVAESCRRPGARARHSSSASSE
jgi:hypothetical protein